MGRLKDKLLQLEEEGIIKWNDELAFYYKALGDPTEQFDLAEYLSTVDPKRPMNRYGRE